MRIVSCAAASICDALRETLCEREQMIVVRSFSEIIREIDAGDDNTVVLLHEKSWDVAVGAVRDLRALRRSKIIVLIGVPSPALRRIPAYAAILGAGADDVQLDDIDPRELHQRILAVGRRGSYFDHQRCAILDGYFDAETGVVVLSTGTIRLPPQQARLLGIMLAAQNRTLTRAEIMDQMFGHDADERHDKFLDVLLCYVRAKIEKVSGGVQVIETIWGHGLRLVPEGFKRNLYRPRQIRQP